MTSPQIRDELVKALALDLVGPEVRNIDAGVLIRSPYFATRLATHFESLAATGDLKRVL